MKTPDQLAAEIVPPGDELVFATIIPASGGLEGIPEESRVIIHKTYEVGLSEISTDVIEVRTLCRCIHGSFGEHLRHTIAAAIEEYAQHVKEQDWR